MDKQTIEQAANNYIAGTSDPLVVDAEIQAFIAGAEFAMPKWIPVEVERPLHNIKVLVYVANQYFTEGLAIAFIDKFNKWQILFDDSRVAGHFSSDYVVAWMSIEILLKP